MTSVNKHGANEFEIISFVENGKGSKLYDVVQKQRNRKYTMEVTPHQQDISTNSRLQKHSQLQCHYITQLKYSFQTKSRKYFILTHMDTDKNLSNLISQRHILNDDEARFIIAEIIFTLEELHGYGIPYGQISINDIYFGTKGHVLLRRTYCGQTYWMKSECYNCLSGECKNMYHRGMNLSSGDMTKDWNSVGKLLLTLLTGEDTKTRDEFVLLQRLPWEAADFVKQFFVRTQPNIENIKNHSFMKTVNWSHVAGRELLVPDSLKYFIMRSNIRKSKSKTPSRKDSSSACSAVRKDNDSLNVGKDSYQNVSPIESNQKSVVTPPKILVEGVRRNRGTRSESSPRKLDFSKDKRRVRSLTAYTENQSSVSNSTNVLRKHSLNPQKNYSSGEGSGYDNYDKNTLKSKNTNESLQRKRSIDCYQKRLEEISKVLDSNRTTVQSLDADNRNNSNSREKFSTERISSQPTSPREDEFSVEKQTLVNKIYSENDAIRNILSKYGLLDKSDTSNKSEQVEVEDTVRNTTSPDPNNNVNENTNFQNYSYTQTDSDTTSESDEDISNNQNYVHYQRQIFSDDSDESNPQQVENIEQLHTTPQIYIDQNDEKYADTFEESNHNDVKEKKFSQTKTPKEEIIATPAQNTVTLIDKLQGLRVSTSFYGSRTGSQSSSQANSQANSQKNSPQMKRHSSDSEAFNRTRHVKSPTITRSFTTTQSLLATLRSPITKRDFKKLNSSELDSPRSGNDFGSSNLKDCNSTSCDSGLNEPIEYDTDQIINKERRAEIYNTELKSNKSCGVERNDSGVVDGGLRLWKPGNPDTIFLEQEHKKIQDHVDNTCDDCGKENLTELFQHELEKVCKSCDKSRVERKQAVTELIETEVNYGEDLRILKEEFYIPIKRNSICTQEEISKLFVNLQELVDVNAKLCASLQYGLEVCLLQEDNDYEHLAVGEVFLKNVEFFEAYEQYCAKQHEALDFLNYLQKKSELLKIFLSVSSKENSKLRKMDLKAFLVMPVQRIMKYPLLLSRIYKHTPKKYDDRRNLKLALSKMEDQITQINTISRQVTTTPRTKKTGSVTSVHNIDSTNISNVRKMVSNLLEWKLEDTLVLNQDQFEIMSQDLVGLQELNKISLKKIVSLSVLLCVNGATDNYEQHLTEKLKSETQNLNSPCEIKDAVVILLKRKNFEKCLIYKKPLTLKECVCSQNINIPVAFEICENERQPITFIARNASMCKEWKTSIDFVINSLNQKWRKRRGGMSNIMIPTLQ